MMKMTLLAIIFIGSLAIPAIHCLKMTELQVPSSILRGQPAQLNCTFDLEEDNLYSIKWYKDTREFYRYIASNDPPGHLYSMPGINLDSSFLHGRSIRLKETDLKSEGSYRCEVSAETFQTVVDEKEMKVYVLPEKGPQILVHRNKYRIGDEVNITCMSSPSKPPTFLQWDVNGKEVQQQFVTKLTPLEHTDGLLSSMLTLRFRVEPAHFRGGQMKLGCTAFISEAFTTTTSEIVATNKVKGGEQHALATNPNGPTISGERTKYREGDTVNVNCTASKSHPPAELRWFINEKEAPTEYLRQYEPIRFSDHQVASVLGIIFTVQPRHFLRGSLMRLACSATFFKVTDMATDEMVITSRNQHSSSGFQVYIRKPNDPNGTMKTIDFDCWRTPILLTLLASLVQMAIRLSIV